MSSDPEALARVEKKLDVVLEKLNALLSRQSGMLQFDSPMDQLNQICPLCKQMVQYMRLQGPNGSTLSRKCGCKPPDTTV